MNWYAGLLKVYMLSYNYYRFNSVDDINEVIKINASIYLVTTLFNRCKKKHAKVIFK